MSVPDRPLDLVELLRLFARHEVDYLVIGGVAVQVHGHRRTTKDLDLIPAPAPDNYRRLAAALEEAGAHVRDAGHGGAEIPAFDPDRLALAAIVPPLTTRHGEVHVINDVKGAAPYDAIRDRALALDLDGVPVTVVGLDDLIRMKRATGRPADLEDIAVLTAVQRSSD